MCNFFTHFFGMYVIQQSPIFYIDIIVFILIYNLTLDCHRSTTTNIQCRNVDIRGDGI